MPFERDLLLIGPLDAAALRDGATALIAEFAASQAHVITKTASTPLIGDSQPMQALRGTLTLVADSDASVVVLGENGTGKELVAKQIHDHSPRHAAPYVTVNCSAFNDNLLDSELFGHAKGAFTGAAFDHQGLLEAAHTGTFFLDEVGDMSPALQVKLLRVLQEGTFYRVGSNELRHVDVRIIAATNRDLEGMVKRGEFREDLYYRLNVITVRVPALRQRAEDIPALCEVFLARLAARSGVAKTLAPACLDALMGYAWPGNVRELENEIERMAVLSADEPLIQRRHLSPRIAHELGIPMPLVAESSNPTIAMVPPSEHSLPKVIESTERQMIRDSLIRHRGNKTRAAAELEISRRNLIRLVQKYDLNQPRH